MPLKLIIVGAGIGGLASALAAHKFGHEVCLLERAGALEAVGAGIQISPNGMKVLRALDLEDEVLARGFCPEALDMRLGRSGREIFSIPVRETASRRWGAPYVHIHRADLIDVLQAALARRAPEALHLGVQVDDFCEDGDRILAFATDGTEYSGDVLIGADGIHSTVRARMFGSDEPRFTGHVAWRLVVETDKLGALAPPPTACVWAGAGRHGVTYRLRGGALANFVGVVERTDPLSEAWTAQGTREEALKDFAGWHPVLTGMITAAERHFRWALYDRPPLAAWSKGRAALLGDACHPMTPFMAQGAVMALEDAFVLARDLTQVPGAVSAALQAYTAERHPRTAKVQQRADANGRLFHLTHPVAQAATYGPLWLAGRALPGLIRAQQDAIYGFDVT